MDSFADSSEMSAGVVSVVIPVGGVDRWLDEAVTSVLAAKGVELEVILVFNNGASVPANWPPLLDTRVRVLHFQERLGPAGAAQVGVDASRGEFIAHLDADDRMAPGRLQAQRDWLRSHPETVLVSSQVRHIDDSGTVVGAFSLPSGADVRRPLIALNVAPHSAWMMRARAVREAGGYDVSMSQMEDYDLLLRLGVQGSIAVLSEELTDYRLHPSQLSRAVRPDGHYVRVIASRRRALGAAIGMSPARVGAARVRWEWQQWTMYAGRSAQGWLRQKGIAR